MSKRQNIEDIYPLSPVQRGILFHSLEHEGERMYFFQIVLTLSGEVDFDAFRLAWQRLIDRHAILRTAFVWKNLEQPLQVVQRQATLQLDVIDDTPSDPDAWDRFRTEFLRRDRERGLVLSRAPLMRLTALRMPQGTYTIIWSFHHLIADAWSQSLLLAELFQQYDAIQSGRTLSLEKPPSFRSYIEWLQKRSSAGEEAFWKKIFADADNPAKVRVRCAPESEPGTAAKQQPVHHEFSMDQSRALRKHAQALGVTLSAMVQGALSVLLAKYSRSDDVVFGVTVATRPTDLPNSEAMIGPMLNTLPLRVRVRRGETIRELLERVQQTGLDILEYSSSPLTSIREWTGVASSSELFESILVFENAPFDSDVAQRIKALCANVEVVESANYSLSLKVTPGPPLGLTVFYDTARFNRAFAERLLSHVVSLLTQFSSGSEMTVGNLRLNADDETRVDQLNTEEVRTAAALFAAAVERNPHAVALETHGRKMSYGELNARAASLSAQLRAHGVREDTPVVVCLPVGTRQVIAALAIWKAGGIYAPFDIKMPDERLLYQLHNINPVAILCRNAEAPRFAGAGRIIVIDPVEETPVEVVEDINHGINNHPLSGAYLIHTSGSTGRPRGVVVSHYALHNLFRASERLDAGPGSRVLQSVSPSFDASVFEMAEALFYGATLVQPEEDEVLLGNTLVDFLDRSAITHATLQPSLLAALPPAPLPALQTLVVGGEACTAEVVRRWANGRRLLNCYGPTEATVWSTVKQLAAGDAITIGNPIRGVQAYILDLHDQPLPEGIFGELVLGGESIARGYLGEPAITAERFIPDFLGNRSGARLYRTGDLACYTDTGEIDFGGRVDQQIKLRGYRIETGEIESVLMEHPDVSAAAVVLVPDGGSSYLAAFVVPRSEIISEELMTWAATKLPEYSVPAHLQIIAEMPLTHAGKVDRANLIESANRNSNSHAESTPPATEVEALLALFWGQITGLAQVNVEEDLFDQKGDSLRIMDLVGRIGQDLGVSIPIPKVFDSPTLTAVAAYVLQESGSAEKLKQRAEELLKRRN